MKRLLRAASVLLVGAMAVWGQATAGLGAISGTVRDSSGSPVPAAKVVVTNPSLGLTRELNTTDAGLFSAPALTPSEGYKVSVSKQGFANYEAVNLVVQVGTVLNLNVTVAVGSISTQVEVAASAALVDDVKTETSTVV